MIEFTDLKKKYYTEQIQNYLNKLNNKNNDNKILFYIENIQKYINVMLNFNKITNIVNKINIYNNNQDNDIDKNLIIFCDMKFNEFLKSIRKDLEILLNDCVFIKLSNIKYYF